MKVKDLFKHTNILQSIGGLKIFLDKDNCQVVNKTKNDDSVRLNLKRASDGGEAQSYLRVREKFISIAPQLLSWAFVSDNIMGLTLNQLDEFETNLNIENFQGRLKITS
jgi:hypothetical protein